MRPLRPVSPATPDTLAFSAVFPLAAAAACFAALAVGSCQPRLSQIEQAQGNGNCGGLAEAETANLFVLGDAAISNTDTEGRLVVGGNATLTNLGIGNQLSNSNGGRDDLLVGGTVNFQSGQVYNGNAVSAGAATYASVGFPHGSSRIGPTGIDFAQAGTDLRALSDQLAALAPTGSTTSPFGHLTLVGADPNLNVFAVTAAQLATANELDLTAPNGSTVVVNVDGVHDQFGSYQFFLNNTSAKWIVWNFPQATSLGIGAIGIAGSLLAPRADVTFNNGHIDGTLVAKTVQGTGQYHDVAFAGCLPLPPPVAPACSPAPLGVAGAFSGFVLGDMVHHDSDTSGRLAVGGNATLGGYGVGDALANSHGARDDLVVGKNLTYTNGQVFNGNLVYGGTAALSGVGIPNGSARQQAGIIDFAAAATQLAALSAHDAALAATGTTTVDAARGITLAGTDPTRNVFTVAAADLAVATSLRITAPAGATVLVNVTGASVSLSNFEIFYSGVTVSRVLFNLPQATTLSVSGFNVNASVLAPLAAATFNNGQANGTLVVASLQGTGQIHDGLFDGCLP